MNKFTKTEGNHDPHVEASQLLLFVDKQLSNADAAMVQAHIEICWLCQSELSKIQDAISSYVDYRRYAYSEDITPPPNDWRDFEQKLRVCALDYREETTDPIWRQVISAFTKPWTGAWNLLVQSSSVRFLSRAPISVITSSAILIIMTVFFVSYKGPDGEMSAAEIIRKADWMQEQRLRSLPQPVVYQELRVRRSSPGSEHSDSLTVDTWNDVGNRRTRKSVGKWSQVLTHDHDVLSPVGTSSQDRSSPKTRGGKNEDQDAPPLLKEVDRIYAANHLDSDCLISPGQFAAWRDSQTSKEDAVEKTRLENGEEAYRVKTSTTESPLGLAGPVIREMELVVRASDWHAVSENMIVATPTGRQSIEIAELDFRLIPLDQLEAELFALPTKTVANASAVTAPLARLGSTSPLEYQVEALERLDQVDGLVQDQLRVRMTQKDKLEIQGVVPTEERKLKVIGALGSLAKNPAVKVEISSAEEAEEAPGTSNSKSLRVESVEVSVGRADGNPILRSYLVAKKQLSGAALEKEIQRFASNAVDHSIQAQLHALALKQIVNTFSMMDVNSASPKAMERWRAMVVRHAEGVRRETDALRDQLMPVFAQSQSGDPASANPQGASDLKSAVEHLCEIAAANDRVLWKALAPSTDETSGDGIRSAQFWESMKKIDLLASNIVRMANP